MKNKIAHIISKSISHNIKLLSEGYFDDMFDNTDDIKDNGFLDDIQQDQEIRTHELTIKTLQDLSTVHITPLLLSSIENKQDSIITDFKFPKEKYNKETHRYEIEYTAKTLISARKWYLLLSAIVNSRHSINRYWTVLRNMCSPLYINFPQRSSYLSQVNGSGPGSSMWFLDFNKDTEVSDITNYIKEHPYLFKDVNMKITRSKYTRWLNQYKKYKTKSEFFNKLLEKSNLYESCIISPNKGIAITTQIQYAEPDDVIYTKDELKTQQMYIKQENSNSIYYRKVYFIYTIQFTNDYNFEKEIANLDD